MSFYFCATGNSKQNAKRLAESLSENIAPFLDVLRKSTKVDGKSAWTKQSCAT